MSRLRRLFTHLTAAMFAVNIVILAIFVTGGQFRDALHLMPLTAALGYVLVREWGES